MMDAIYHRQMIMPEIGQVGQEKLNSSRVLVVGAGGLGSPVLLYLGAAGIGTLAIVDFDVVTLSNLNRQVLYTVGDVGQHKTKIAAERIHQLNPYIHLVTLDVHINQDLCSGFIRDYDVVVDASDNLETKSLLNVWCVQSKIPLVWAAVSRFEGQMSTYIPGNACRACVFPRNPEPGTYPSPAELGVVGAAAGIMGTLQALEVIKVLLSIGSPLVNKMLLFDGLHGEFDVITFDKDPFCPVCGAENGKEP